jgi:hypothetical protein
MGRRLIAVAAVSVALAVCAVYLAAQLGFGQPYVWVRTGSGWRHRPLTGSAVTTTASEVRIEATPAKTYSFGGGFSTAEVTGTNRIEVALDSTYVLYRATAPTAPGPCSLGGGASGQGLLAVASDGYVYLCIPAAPGTNGQTTYRWARAPLEIDW